MKSNCSRVIFFFQNRFGVLFLNKIVTVNKPVFCVLHNFVARVFAREWHLSCKLPNNCWCAVASCNFSACVVVINKSRNNSSRAFSCKANVCVAIGNWAIVFICEPSANSLRNNSSACYVNACVGIEFNSFNERTKYCSFHIVYNNKSCCFAKRTRGCLVNYFSVCEIGRSNNAVVCYNKARHIALPNNVERAIVKHFCFNFIVNIWNMFKAFNNRNSVFAEDCFCSNTTVCYAWIIVNNKPCNLRGNIICFLFAFRAEVNSYSCICRRWIFLAFKVERNNFTVIDCSAVCYCKPAKVEICYRSWNNDIGKLSIVNNKVFNGWIICNSNKKSKVNTVSCWNVKVFNCYNFIISV